MLTLYQYEISPFCDKVRRVLNLKGQHFETKNVSVADTLRGVVKAMAPAGKLPILDMEDRRIADSTDIIEAIETRWPDPPLYPDDPVLKARVHVLEDWADESLYFYEVRLRFTEPHNAQRCVPLALAEDGPLIRWVAKKVMPKEMAKIARAQGVGRKPLAEVEKDLARHFTALESLLSEGDWLVGEQLTVADIAVFVQLFCLEQTQEGQSALAPCKRVKTWMKRVDEASKG